MLGDSVESRIFDDEAWNHFRDNIVYAGFSRLHDWREEWVSRLYEGQKVRLAPHARGRIRMAMAQGIVHGQSPEGDLEPYFHRAGVLTDLRTRPAYATGTVIWDLPTLHTYRGAPLIDLMPEDYPDSLDLYRGVTDKETK